ncbi:MAG: 2-dehydropantoate 2-reductase N-terminal domain-containing protein [Chloroflexota bacterium]|nr:2-dehydropantoate 2-reductase N-terminal domain-containing protein [Chloroflexota bacterium]
MTLSVVLAAALLQKHRSKQKQRARSDDIRVLIIRAGVIGSTYACHLAKRGVDVTLLASEDRFQYLTVNGVHVRNIITNQQETGPVYIVSTVPTKGEFDPIILAVRYHQLGAAFEHARPLMATTPLLLLQNNLLGIEGTITELDAHSLLMGFPGTAGLRSGSTVCSLPLWWGTTLIGDPQGMRTQGLHQTALISRRAGLRVKVRDDIAPWLRTHTTMITVLAGYIYKNGGSIQQFGQQEGRIHLCQQGLSEALHALGTDHASTPPDTAHTYDAEAPWLARIPMRLASLTPWGRLLVDGYVAHKSDELGLFCDQLLSLAARPGARIPNPRSLAPYFG